MLQKVECAQSYSVGGGSFADVYCGSMGDLKVAIKRIRTYSGMLAPTESQKEELERVRYEPFNIAVY